MVRRLEKIQRIQEASESGNERDPRVGNELDAHSETAAAHSSNVTAVVERAAEADTGPDEQPISLDQTFGMLSNHRRRQVFRILTETEQIELGDLAEQIAARELDKPRGQLTSQERKRLYISLYQTHLPKLADVDAITYNKRRGLIEPGPTLHSFTPYLPGESEPPPTETQERRWTDYIPNILK